MTSRRCVHGACWAAAGSSETVQTGDVVEELLIRLGGRGGPTSHAAPFNGGRAALQKLLHTAYKRGETSVEVRMHRSVSASALGQQLVSGGGGGGGGDSSGELQVDAAAATEARMQACMVPQESVGGGGGIGRSRQYVLRSIRDPTRRSPRTHAFFSSD